MNNFYKRVITGTVFVTVLVLAILFGKWTFSLLFLLISILTLQEFYQLIRYTDHRPQYLYGIVAGTVTYMVISFIALGVINLKWLWLLLPVFVFSFVLELFRKSHQPAGNVALTIFGILYIPFSFALLSWIGTYSYFKGITLFRPEPVLGLFILIWMADTGAYISGKSFGKRKLMPSVSPGKTWEGLAGGAILTLITAWLLIRLDFDPAIRPFQWILMAVTVQVFGTLGDLSESMLKRAVGVKDSGNILPGHGGLLDRFDAALVAVPVTAAVLYLTT